MFDFMSHNHKVSLVLNKDKMVIKKNNEKGTDLSIITTLGKYHIEVARYTDNDPEYLLNRVKEILDYIQD